MNWDVFVEIFGIAASIILAFSMMLKNVKWLRFVNLAGSLCFAVYGFWLGSISIVLLNLFTSGVNIFYLVGMMKKSKHPDTFDILFVNPQDDEYARRFILFYADDIKKFFPAFNPDLENGTLAGAECCFILRETIPVSIFAYRKGSNGENLILLDYSIPAYRDLKNARFFFDSALKRIAKSGDIFNADAEVPAHARYLKRIGFERIGHIENAELFRKKVD
ncbi:MAG: YgjV family protein [Treponema sp.]|jgi:hypothetical protein|nr:YgjV family protein [Treponema sp.]